MTATIITALSDAVIRRHSQDPSVRQIKDPRFSLLFRFHKDRDRGSFHLRHYQGGRERWKKVGAFPGMTTKVLFARLPEIKGQLAVDPASDNLAVSTWATVGDLLCWYRDRSGDNANVSSSRRSSVKSAINRQLLPVLSDVPLGAFGSEKEGRTLLDEKLIWPMQSTYSLSFVKSVFGVLKAAFKQAYRLKRIESNPLAPWVFSDFIQARIKPKDPSLRVERLTDFMGRLPACQGPERLIPLLMLLHGTRVGETRHHRWDWIDWRGSTLTIPGRFTKNKREHQIPLSSVAVQALKEYQASQSRRGVSSVWLFPGAKPGRPIGKTKANELFQVISEKAWTSHDLRKLARTVWADLGVDYIVGELLLNHTLKDLDATYIHTAMAVQKREALTRYHDWLILQGLTIETETETRSRKNTPADQTSEAAA